MNGSDSQGQPKAIMDVNFKKKNVKENMNFVSKICSKISFKESFRPVFIAFFLFTIIFCCSDYQVRIVHESM